MRLLLAEDDEQLAANLKKGLNQAGYAVDICSDGINAEFQGDVEPYDVVILDLGLPGRPGLEVLKNWRSRQNALPVLVLTARDAWHERVDGLKAGADDYLGKPFHLEELLARLNALIRRSQGQAPTVLELAGYRLDEDRQQVTRPDGTLIELTGIEYRLLHYFMLHPGIILSKSRLYEHVYEGDVERDSNVIEVYVNRLRQKLDKNLIKTLRGQGYRLEASPP